MLYNGYTNIFQREVSCFMIGREIVSITTNNTTGNVEFDWNTIWSKFKDASTIAKSDVCMIHTHPINMPSMSPMDKNMVQGWQCALGVPIKFNIISFNETMNMLYIKKYKCTRGQHKVNIDMVDYIPNTANITAHQNRYHINDALYLMSIAETLPDKNLMDVMSNYEVN